MIADAYPVSLVFATVAMIAALVAGEAGIAIAELHLEE